MSEKSNDTKQRLDRHLSGSPANTSIADVTTTGTKTLCAGDDAIPANAIGGGEHFVCDAAGSFITSNPAPTGMTFSVFWGSVATGTDLQDLSTPALPVSLTASWSAEIHVVWLSATSAHCTIKLWWHSSGGAAGTAPYIVASTTTGLDTTVAKFLTLAFGFTGTGVTLKTTWAHWTRRR